MHRFEKILFFMREGDQSNAALERAVARTKRNDAVLTLVDVIRPLHGMPSNYQDLLEPDLSGLNDMPIWDDIKLSMVEKRESQLKDLAEVIERNGVMTDISVLSGVPFAAITQEVIRNRHDLVILAADEDLPGSLRRDTCMRLIQNCPCPVWAFRQEQAKINGCILAAINPSPYDDSSAEMNRMIIDLTMALADTDEVEVILVHAWGGQDAATEKKWSSWLPPEKAENYLHQMSHIRLALIEDRWLKAYRGSNVSYEVIIKDGDPGNVISRIAKTRGAELLVMGSCGGDRLGGGSMGSTAASILENISCSVLAVKPPGFVSPVVMP